MKRVVVYLVRHGAITAELRRCFVGQLDVPLSEEGIEQAQALRNWLRETSFSRIIASDLTRSVETASILAGGNGSLVEAMRALREIHLGTWEGMSFEDVQRLFPQEYAERGRDIENWRTPDGESFADCRARVLDALGKIVATSEGNVLLAGHAGVNRLILCSALEIPTRRLHDISQDCGCLNIVALTPGRTRVHLMNGVPGTNHAQQLCPAPDDGAARKAGTGA